MSTPLLLGIDEGTTSVKAALFDSELQPVAETRRVLAVSHPRPGWVEQDPELILEAVVGAVEELLERHGGREVIAAGIDHQGESVLAWDAESGRALSEVIVWQDKRQEALLEGLDRGIAARSGLPLDPYFSAGKLAWLLANDASVQSARDAGTLRLGTLDTFLSDRLGGRFATDLSTASRTQLLARGGRDWDQELLSAFGLQRAWLPSVGPTFGALGELRHERWGAAIPLTAQLVDQQAALAGSGAVRPGELKASYGTGVFVLGRTGEPVAGAGLLPTVAWAAPDQDGQIGEVAHALDGGVFSAGSLLDWLAEDLGLAKDVPTLLEAAASVGDSAGVILLPALSGIGAPWWRPAARGVIAGLTQAAGPGHIAYAALEAIAWRVADIVDAAGELTPVLGLRVDGGLTNNETLVGLQADALGIPITVGRPDTTVLGAAMLAGVGAGIFASIEEAAEYLPAGHVVLPGSDPAERSLGRESWRSFLEAAAPS